MTSSTMLQKRTPSSRTSVRPLRRYAFPTSTKTLIRSEDKSIGLKLTSKKEMHHGQTTVFGVEPRGPAELAGIRRGHVLIEVNGKCVEGFPHDQVVELLRGGSRAIRLCVCNSDKYIPPHKTSNNSKNNSIINRTATQPNINQTPEASDSGKRKILTRRLNYDYDDTAIPFLSELPVQASTPVRKSRRFADNSTRESANTSSTYTNSNPHSNSNDETNHIIVQDYLNPNSISSTQLSSLLAIFKHLLNHGGLTQSGRMLYDSVGLNDLLEETAMEQNIQAQSSSPTPPGLLDLDSMSDDGGDDGAFYQHQQQHQQQHQYQQHQIQGTTSQLRARVIEAQYTNSKIDTKNQRNTSSIVSVTKRKSSDAFKKSPTTRAGSHIISTSPSSMSRPSKASKIASLAEPKWPIDGRKAKLPSVQLKKPNALLTQNKWQFVDLDRTLEENIDDEMRIISHNNNEGVWKAYL